MSTNLSEAPVQPGREALGVLLDRAAVGDVDAAGEVYDRTAGAVYRLVLLVVGDPEVAQDVCRQAFREVWQVWSAASPARRAGASAVPAQSWVLTVAHRCATEYVRRVTASGGQGGFPYASI